MHANRDGWVVIIVWAAAIAAFIILSVRNSRRRK